MNNRFLNKYSDEFTSDDLNELKNELDKVEEGAYEILAFPCQCCWNNVFHPCNCHESSVPGQQLCNCNAGLCDNNCGVWHIDHACCRGCLGVISGIFVVITGYKASEI